MSGPTLRPSAIRLGLGGLGVLAIVYGAYLVLSRAALNQPIEVAKWAIGSDVVVDGVLIPLVIGIGWLLSVVIRGGRSRSYVQGALIAMGIVTLISVPLIYRRGDSQPGQALLQQNYGLHLAVLLAIIAVAAMLAYLGRVVRDQRASAAKVRPATDHTSATE